MLFLGPKCEFLFCADIIVLVEMTHAASSVKDEENALKKNGRRRLRVGDPDFVPPDGGWGWLVVVACGFSNVMCLRKENSFATFLLRGLLLAQHISDVPTVRSDIQGKIRKLRFQQCSDNIADKHNVGF